LQDLKFKFFFSKFETLFADSCNFEGREMSLESLSRFRGKTEKKSFNYLFYKKIESNFEAKLRKKSFNYLLYKKKLKVVI
jgi:hypothetical protein